MKLNHAPSVLLHLVLRLLVIVAACHPVACSGAQLESAHVIGELDTSIPDLMAKARIPGLSVALIWDGAVVWQKAYGVKNIRTGEPVDENTVFEAASLTKPFFAYLAMMMVEKGELNLDKPLYEYLPHEAIESALQHPLDYPGFRADWLRRITARMVLSHSSGLPHGQRGKPYPLLFEPGTRFSYSADGYRCLQMVIERLKGEPLEEIMRKQVLEPLGMARSSLVWNGDYGKNSAVGHRMLGKTTGEPRKYTSAHAAASLYTTAGDYAKFVAAVLNETGLRKETIKTMLAPQIDVAKNVTWSLGFGIEETSKGRAFWQWGDYGIFRNYSAALKEKRIGIVYLTNSFNGLSIGPDIVQQALGIEEDFGLRWLSYFHYDSAFAEFLTALERKPTEEAVSICRSIIAKNPDALSEGMMNSVGYELLGDGTSEKAIGVFKLNIEAYPESAKPYDSLAEAYERSGNAVMAAEYYQKALDAIATDPTRDEVSKNQLRESVQKNLERVKKVRSSARRD